jgi:hypothetical protein
LTLRKTAVADDVAKPKRQSRLYHFPLWIRQANVCKHIAATFSDAHPKGIICLGILIAMVSDAISRSCFPHPQAACG